MSDELKTITPTNDCTPQISILCTLISEARKNTIEIVQNLDHQSINALTKCSRNTPGGIAMHIVALEKLHGFLLFGEDGVVGNLSTWNDYLPGNLSNANQSNLSHEKILRELALQNELTIANLKKQKDEWLIEKTDRDPYVFNHLYLLYHRVEDEIRHQGQVKLLVNRNNDIVQS